MQKNLTLNRVLKKRKKNSQDADFLKLIEEGKIDEKIFDRLLKKAAQKKNLIKK